ncbi:hypothetical protein RB595_006394 [Gaeumannomyces hyphopodioides]
MASEASDEEVIVPFRAHISDLSAEHESLRKLTLESPVEGSSTAATASSLPIVHFASLLQTLGVPGPSAPGFFSELLGSGAQFTVHHTEIIFDDDPEHTRYVVATKTPRFFLEATTRLDLSAPAARHPLRDLVLEVTALCHPNLRNHDNIVKVLGWGWNLRSWHTPPFIALELASGDLERWIASPPFSSYEVQRQIISDVAAALDAIHRVGLVHGDVKPSNILVFEQHPRWVGKLSDFGCGTNFALDGTFNGRGTIGWRAPELCQHWDHGTSFDVDIMDRIDMYAFGLVSCSVLCATASPQAWHEREGASQKALEALGLQKHIPPSASPALEHMVRRTLCWKPRDRAAKAAELVPPDADGDTDPISSLGLECLNLQQTDPISSNPAYRRQYWDWRIQEIPGRLWTSLKALFFDNNQPLSPNMSFSLCLEEAELTAQSTDPNSHHHTLLQMLSHAARGGSLQAQGLVSAIHEYYGWPVDEDLAAKKREWLFDSIATGALTSFKTARTVDGDAFDASLAKFHGNGGFNRLYSGFSVEALNESMRNLERTAAVTPLNDEGDCILHLLASFSQRSDALGALQSVATAPNVNTLNRDGETALYRACMCGAYEAVILLLGLGADPALRPFGSAGPSCLHWLIAFHPDKMETVAAMLVDKGASTHALTSSWDKMLHYPFKTPFGSPLHWAVEFSCVEAVVALVRCGADPGLRDGVRTFTLPFRDPGFEPRSAGEVGHEDVILGPPGGSTPIEIAVRNWDAQVLEILLRNAQVRDKGEGIGTFHHLVTGEWRRIDNRLRFYNPFVRGEPYARRSFLRQTVGLLVAHGLDIDLLAPSWPRGKTSTALMLAVFSDHLDVAEALLEAGANVNIADSTGATALMYIGARYLAVGNYAPNQPQIRAAELLLASGAGIGTRDMMGRSPILVFAIEGLMGAVEVMLQHGAAADDAVFPRPTGSRFDYDYPVFGNLILTLFDDAKQRRVWDAKLASMLARHLLPILGGGRLPVSSTSEDGHPYHTILHRAAFAGYVRCAVTLINAGFDVNAVMVIDGGPPETPLDRAVWSRHHTELERRGVISKTGLADLIKDYDDIIAYLKDRGGLQAEELLKPAASAAMDIT